MRVCTLNKAKIDYFIGHKAAQILFLFIQWSVVQPWISQIITHFLGFIISKRWQPTVMSEKED